MGGNPHNKAVRLAGAALHAALGRKWESAAQYVRRIDDECGGAGIASALMAWVDTMTDHATDGVNIPYSGRLSVIDGSSGRVGDVDEMSMPDGIRWAGRLIRARAGRDLEAWSLLIQELPHDGEVVGERVCAVLEMVAYTINGLPRGYALMDRSQ